VTILALDTTSQLGSLAIHRNGKTVAETTLHSSDGFAHLLFPAIERILAEGKVRLAEIDCFAAASGPGSFTGVRVGLSAVKGLAEATHKPAVGVSNLRALSSFGKSPFRAAILDARRGEVYAGVYNATLEPVLPETVLPLQAWLERLDPAHEYEFIRQSGSSIELPGPHVIEAPQALAPAIALCAGLDRCRNGWLDPALLDANYVRRSDAELFWKDA